ncbi:MAG: ABC transporter permease [Thermodesulfovibrionales bacterium]|nr:ABC transporter permease [Thermodesulfovibrionales bacterium]
MTGIIENFRNNPVSLAALLIIILLLAVALFAPYIAPYSPTEIDVDNVLSPPSLKHPFGTDELGRDVLSRMIYGVRVSLSVGFVAVSIAVFTGMIVGALAGYYGGRVDSILMRFVDIMLTFPTIFLILAVVIIVEQSIWTIMIIIGLTGWMDVARLVRAEFLTLREREFVLAARALGLNNIRIIFRHILPNSLAPVFVAAVFGIAGAILTESALSFLGFGIRPPEPSWGNILSSGKDHIEVAWWLSFFPGLAIFITTLSYNLVGETLRDSLDPRLRTIK